MTGMRGLRLLARVLDFIGCLAMAAVFGVLLVVFGGPHWSDESERDGGR